METNSFKNTSDILKYIDYITDKKEVCLLGSGNILEEVFLNLEDKFTNENLEFSMALNGTIQGFRLFSSPSPGRNFMPNFVERFFLQNTFHCVKV